MKRTLVFDRLNVTAIISLWIGLIILFSFAYTIVLNSGIGNAAYLSILTATTLGYYETVPVAKTLIVIEAILSIALIGLFIGKIVSSKQEELIEKVNELSLEEATHNAITGLYIFRSQSRSADKKQQSEALDMLDETLAEYNSASIVHTKDRHHELMHLSLIINSLTTSLSRLIELSSSRRTDWKKESTTAVIAETQKTVSKIQQQYNTIRSDDELSKKIEEKLEDLNKTLTTLQKSTQAP